MVDSDALNVSLHDPVLHEEVVLTVRLMLAANDSGSAMSTSELDEILFGDSAQVVM